MKRFPGAPQPRFVLRAGRIRRKRDGGISYIAFCHISCSQSCWHLYRGGLSSERHLGPTGEEHFPAKALKEPLWRFAAGGTGQSPTVAGGLGEWSGWREPGVKGDPRASVWQGVFRLSKGWQGADLAFPACVWAACSSSSGLHPGSSPHV